MNSYLQQSYLQQWEKVCHLLKVIDAPEKEDSKLYDYDLVTFFQECWHLKDWILNDPKVNQTVKQKVKDEIHKKEACIVKYPNILICADLANLSKHMNNKSSESGARITNRNMTFYLGKGEAISDHIITLDNGTKYHAKDVARRAVQEWEGFMKANGLL